MSYNNRVASFKLALYEGLGTFLDDRGITLSFMAELVDTVVGDLINSGNLNIGGSPDTPDSERGLSEEGSPANGDDYVHGVEEEPVIRYGSDGEAINDERTVEEPRVRYGSDGEADDESEGNDADIDDQHGDQTPPNITPRSPEQGEGSQDDRKDLERESEGDTNEDLESVQGHDGVVEDETEWNGIESDEESADREEDIEGSDVLQPMNRPKIEGKDLFTDDDGGMDPDNIQPARDDPVPKPKERRGGLKKGLARPILKKRSRSSTSIKSSGTAGKNGTNGAGGTDKKKRPRKKSKHFGTLGTNSNVLQH